MRNDSQESIGVPAHNKPTVPFFYKYKSADNLGYLEPLILRHELYLPSVSQLNDPLDCMPRLPQLSESEMETLLINAYIKENPTASLDRIQAELNKNRGIIQMRGVEWMREQLFDILAAKFRDFRVYSMSKSFNNMSMWAKYAGDHTGYCLEFANTGELFGTHAAEVAYANEAEPFDVNKPGYQRILFLFHKRPEWSSEEEVRLVLPAGKGSKVILKKPEWLTKIILGEKMASANEKQIREWAQIRTPALPVYRARVDKLNHTFLLEAE